VAPVALLLFDLQAVRTHVDAHAFRLLAILIKFISHYRDDNYQSAHDQKENIAARHKKISFYCFFVRGASTVDARASGPRRDMVNIFVAPSHADQFAAFKSFGRCAYQFLRYPIKS
jgi:hypothetical protein